MVYNDIKHILPLFDFRGQYSSAIEMQSGNINNTYHLIYKGDGKQQHYALQHINSYVFKKPMDVMHNIELVTNHLKENLIQEGIPPERRVLDIIPTRNGASFYKDASNSYWRAYTFIGNATAYDTVKKSEHFYEAGRAFGEFQKRLYDFPTDQLIDTIPNFHNTPRRFYAFVQSVADDRMGHVKELEAEIEFFFERRKMMSEIVKLLANGTLPVRVTHNDTKINNVMIDDETDKAICVIDLDTVMAGSSLYDFGDAIRFGASTAVEDEPDVDKIALDLELYKLFTKGFLSETKGFLEKEELRLLPLGVKVITCELAMRFLMDYIDGDLYFKVRSPDHNLIRAHAQMKLLTDIEEKYDRLVEYIEQFI